MNKLLLLELEIKSQNGQKFRREFDKVCSFTRSI